MLIRPWSPRDPIPPITKLLHSAYAELGGMGFRYLACSQDDATTLRRLTSGASYVAEEAGEIAGTITIGPGSAQPYCDWYLQPGVGVFWQLAVDPARQRLGIGSRLLDEAEAHAREQGWCELACDTAEGAHHLIRLYSARGYRQVQTAQWDHTNYRSVILSKTL